MREKRGKYAKLGVVYMPSQRRGDPIYLLGIIDCPSQPPPGYLSISQNETRLDPGPAGPRHMIV